MRLSRLLSTLAAFALILFTSRVLIAQEATVAGPPTGAGAVVGSVVLGGPAAVQGAPYSAIRKTTRVQKLADGTTITHESTQKEARDASGRTYHENVPNLPANAEGQSTSISTHHVFDPVNHIEIMWNSNSSVATVVHMSEPGSVQRMAPRPLDSNTVTSPSMVARSSSRTGLPKPQREDLGARTINGVETRGTRTTREIPAGREGNDQPLTVVHENWYSPELKLQVLTVNDDPRTGTSTMELTNIERSEPDPSLFQVPEGYTVRDRYPNQPN